MRSQAGIYQIAIRRQMGCWAPSTLYQFKAEWRLFYTDQYGDKVTWKITQVREHHRIATSPPLSDSLNLKDFLGVVPLVPEWSKLPVTTKDCRC